MNFSSYITGFVDGEGSFSVSFNKRSGISVGVEVRPSFSISQHKRNKDIVVDLYNYFECGSVRFSKKDQNYKFEVRSLEDLQKKIIPHFIKNPLQTSKKKDLILFQKICNLMSQKKHLTLSGIEKIAYLAYKMNNFGSRRYTKDEILRFASKMKV